MYNEANPFLGWGFLISAVLLFIAYKLKKSIPVKHYTVHKILRKIINGCWFTCFIIILMIFDQD